jgi:hypothetical protein
VGNGRFLTLIVPVVDVEGREEWGKAEREGNKETHDLELIDGPFFT